MAGKELVYIGMDVHQKSSTLCVLNPKVPGQGRHRTMRCDTTAKDLERVLKEYAGRCKIVFEVGTQAQWIASIVRPFAIEVQVANGSRMPWLFRDGRKNDRVDAKKLATLLYLDEVPQVHLPSADVSAWRGLINYRRSLVKERGRVRSRIRAVLRSFGRCCPHRSCWTRVGMAWLRSQTFDSARNWMMRQLLKQDESVGEQIREVEGELDRIAEQHPGVALLRTIPGIGPRTAEAIIAFTDELDRFKNRKQYGCYFGMTPKEDSSGQVVRRGRISKHGPSVVRWVLIEAVRSSIRHSEEIRAWFENVCQGRKDRRKKAVVATGRKVLSICFGMLKTGEEFNSQYLLRKVA
jgi:transposase